MADYTPPSADFEEKVRQAIAVPEPDIAFVHQLRSQLVKETTAGILKTRRFSPRLVWGFVAAIFVLVIVLLATSPTVVEAMKRMFGYIPGVGIVEQNSPMRVLSEPVTVVRDGITLTVFQALVSSDKTVLTYRVENIPESALVRNYSEGETPSPYCTLNDSLRLPDGTIFSPTAGQGSGWQLGFQYRQTFNPIPSGVDQATLLVACLLETAPGMAPENWEVPLTFVPAPPDTTVVPVTEITPVPPTVTQKSNPTVSGEVNTPVLAQINTPEPMPLTVERTIELEDGYILIGSFHSITLTNGLVTSPYSWDIRFLDTNGQQVPVDYATDVDLPPSDEHTSAWAYKILGKHQAWPLTITVNTLDAFLEGFQASIEFDTGPDPQSGQEWVINQDLQIDSYTVRILAITRTPDGYAFSLQADPSINGVMLEIRNQGELIQPSGGGGGGGGGDGGLSTSLAYAGQIPAGKLTVVVVGVTVLIPGPWSVQWTPENLPSGVPTPTPSDSSACLTDDIWQQIKTLVPTALPLGLSGKLVIFGPNQDGTVWGISLLNLADNSRQFLVEGQWPVISPDGRLMVYTGNDGLAIYDFSTGKSLALTGTDTTDYRMVWSPDSSRIAFIRSSTNHLMVINVDGTGQQQVKDNSAVYHALVAWADNTHLYITEPGPEGVNIQSVNLADGSVQDLFAISSNKADTVLSYGGQWIAFTNSLGGVHGNGLYIANLDGSERRLVVALDGQALYFPVWSPDNRWLVVSVPDLTDPNAQVVQVLVELDTCQVSPLPDLGGEVYSWGP